MASTFSPSLRIELIGDGDQSGIWGQTTNTNLGTLIEQAIAGVVTITMADANYTLSSFNGVSDEARNQVIIATGTNTAQRNIVVPLVEKTYTINNSTTGGFSVQIIGSSGTGVVIPNGTTTTVYCDGFNVYGALNGVTGNFNIPGNATVTGNATVSGNATITGNLTVSGSNNVVPAGSLLMWSTASAPSGYLLCNGAAVSRSTYAALFAVIGTTFGAGDTTTTFNVPNYTNRMPYGTTIGTTGGSADAIVVTHTHTLSGTTGAMSANATHTHTATDSGHTHLANGFGGAQPGLTTSGTPINGQSSTTVGYANISVSSANVDHTHTLSGTTSSAGSSGTNANLPPYLGINFIIKF